MSSPQLSALRKFVITACVLLLSACANSTYDATANWSVEKLYSEAKDEMANGGYTKAIGYYEKLENRAAGTPLAQQAQLDKAWAQFKNAEPIQAFATLDRFIKLHPASPALDYALYLKGLINFNDDLGLISRVVNQDLAERDPKQAKESFESFRELVTRFPDSKYSEDARLRMAYIKNSLARSDVYVAKYYFSKGAYIAASNRAQNTIKEYRDSPAVEEALFVLMQCYDKLGLVQLREDTKRILESTYPDSKFLRSDTKIEAVKKPWWKVW